MTMMKCIVHIEYESTEVRRNAIEDAVDTALEKLRGPGADYEPHEGAWKDMGWRYFSELMEADRWERGQR